MENKKIEMPSYNDSSVIRFGLSIIFIVFVLIGGWMAFAPLASSSVAVGKVSADLDKKTIQHLEGGIVESIFVKDGDFVKKGDVLLKFQDIQIKGQIEQVNNQIQGYSSLILSKKNRLASLKEEIDEWNELYKQRLVDKLRIRELQREQNTVEGDIANTSAEIAKLKEQLIVIKDTLKRSSILAPVDGIINGLSINTAGGVLSPGSIILDIVPNNSKLLVVAQVPTTDIDKVKIGLLAEIRFSAFDLKQAHVIKGKVIHVSADSFVDEATGMPYYEAKIEVTKEGIASLKDYNFVLVSGMPAEVMIKIGDRTALSYLVKPFTDMLSRSFNEE
jgi:epimerase transport system membrane fusion protein